MASWLIASGADEEEVAEGEGEADFRGESDESAARASAAALAPVFRIFLFHWHSRTRRMS
jgi:hypothetical protein